MNIKRLSAIFFALVFILASALPALALGQTVTENTDFILEKSFTIGWNGCPVTIKGDGSFTHSENGASVSVSFGLPSPLSSVSQGDAPYPVSVHSTVSDSAEYTVEQFALGDESGAICIFSRLTVKNTSDSSVIFPSVTGTVPITQVPSQVEVKESSVCDYSVCVKAPADANAASTLKTETYDSAKKKMKEHWDSYLGDMLTVSGVSESGVKEYSTAIINSAIIGEASASSALASNELCSALLSSGSDAYTFALALMKSSDTLTASQNLESIENIAESIMAGDGALPCPTLEQNLDALLTLQSYSYILKKLSTEDESLSTRADEAKSNACALADSIAAALTEAEKSFSCDWEAVTTDGDFEGIALNGEDFTSASALCSWYTKSVVFSDTVSKDLVMLAKDANAYYSRSGDPASLILSLIAEREDGTVVIGHGSPVSLLSENPEISIKNISLSTGETVNLDIKVEKNSINVNLSGGSSVAFRLEFPVFDTNIEYASVGFDSDSGVVTAPAGTSAVSVRLIQSPDGAEKDRVAGAELEKAISDAYAKKVDDPTSVSKSEFSAALSRAEKARTATRDEKKESAAALIDATASLSPMTAGYSLLIPESGEKVGSLTKSEIYQKFSLPSAGTVDTLFVRGVYSEGISAAVYTLRGDAYTTDELRAETYGKEVEGGISFELDFNAEANTVYVLCIFSEDSDLTLDLEYSDSHMAHTYEAGSTVVYKNASLHLEFSVRQADRKDLDTFYVACVEADVSNFTKESRKTLKSKMNAAKDLLCTPSVTEEEYTKVYDELKKAYDGLDTYASQDKLEKAPIVGLVLIAIVIVLLIATLFSALAARKRMDPDS